MPKPIKIGSAKFLKLQRKWYAKLDKLGHIDVERYLDMNKQPLSTMPRLHGSFIYDPETEELSDEAEYVALADTDKAGFWREVGRLANELPSNDPMKKLALAFAEYGSFSRTAREFKLDRQQTMTKLRRWLKANDLKPATGLSRTAHEKEPAPGPVRHLTKDEIAKLNLVPPSRLCGCVPNCGGYCSPA